MKLFRIALVCMMAFAFTAVLSAAPRKYDKANPFKSELNKIARSKKKLPKQKQKMQPKRRKTN